MSREQVFASTYWPLMNNLVANAGEAIEPGCAKCRMWWARDWGANCHEHVGNAESSLSFPDFNITQAGFSLDAQETTMNSHSDAAPRNYGLGHNVFPGTESSSARIQKGAGLNQSMIHAKDLTRFPFGQGAAHGPCGPRQPGVYSGGRGRSGENIRDDCSPHSTPHGEGVPRSEWNQQKAYNLQTT